MPRTLTLEVYKFSELSDAAKEKARAWWREGEPSGEWWEDVYIDATTCLGYLGFHDLDISFSGFWSQGDGASFTGRWASRDVDPKGLASYAPIDETLKRAAAELAVIFAQFPDAGATVTRNNQVRYAHEYSVVIDMHGDSFDEVDYQTTRDWESSPHGIATGCFVKTARNLMRWIYKQLEADHSDRLSDERVDETIAINGYEFTAEGSSFATIS